MNFHLKIKSISLLFILLFTSSLISAQRNFPAFGTFTQDDIKLKECSFDRSADAVILLDKGLSYFNEDYNLITERRLRIKILKEKGISRANISIPYYSMSEFEYLKSIDAVVITTESDGNIKITALDKKNIYTRQLNRLYSEVAFALPNVKVGSIIDYKYTSVMKSYSGLERWNFQSDIPIIKSAYELSPIPNSEFRYSLYKKQDYPVVIEPDNAAGRIYFEMNNVPGLREEVFSTSPRNYYQRVNFQISSYTSYQGKKSFTKDWEMLSRELINEKSFGSQFKKDLSGTELIKGLPASMSQLEKMIAIHNYVRSEIVWDRVYSRYSESVKTVLDKKKGNSGDINLLLVALLKSAGLKAFPILVSERNHGKVDTLISFLDQFSKVLAYVELNGEHYLLDGTDRNTPYFLVPTDFLNTIGYVVDRDQSRFVKFSSIQKKDRDDVIVNGEIKQDGFVRAEATVTNFDYAKLYKQERFQQNESAYREALVKPYAYFRIDSFQVDGIRTDSSGLIQKIKFNYDLKKSGNYFLLNYNLFSAFTENPFITQHRFTDIDFGAQYNSVFNAQFSFPSNWTPEKLPANKAIYYADRSMVFKRSMEKTGNQIKINILFSINKESYTADEYENIKAFFKEMMDLLEEPILFSSK
jgi:hypothetical protein